MRVVTKAIAPKYSMYFGEPYSADCSMMSKSSTRLNDAIATINKDNPIDALLLPENISGDIPVTNEYISVPM